MSRILKTSELLMSQFMLVMSKQFTVTLEQRFQASTNRSGSWQLRQKSWTIYKQLLQILLR